MSEFLPPAESEPDPSVRYAPGGDWLVVSGRVVVLLPGETEAALVGESWALARDGAGLVELTTTLARHGLSRLSGVGLAVVDEDAVHVVLRGRASLEVDGLRYDDEGRATWAELALPLGPMSMQLGSNDESVSIPLVAGVVRASSVAWNVQDSAIAPSGTPVGDARVPGSDARDADGRHRVPDEATDLDVPSGADDGQEGETLRDEDLKAVVAETPSPTTAAADVAPIDVPIAAPDEAPTPVEEDSYDRLFGATAFVAKSPTPTPTPTAPEPEPAPPLVPEATPTRTSLVDAPLPPDARAIEVAPLPVPHVEPVPEAPARTAATPSTTLIAGLPQWGPDAAAAPSAAVTTTAVPLTAVPPIPPPTGSPIVVPSAAPAPAGETDGMTISRSELQARRSAGPSIHGVRCPAGHANPTEATSCRLCGLEIPMQAATTMPRPALGVLVLEEPVEGAPATITLDGAFILGRRPSVDRVTDTVPRLITLPSPEQDVSRNHVRINVEGWHVLVTDLGSKNGTVVVSPGEPPQRLHADRPVMITPGTRVVLAEVMTYRYETGP